MKSSVIPSWPTQHWIGWPTTPIRLSSKERTSVPPKVSISELLGILKGKTAIKLLKSYPGMREKPYWGSHFWSRGYCVSTIGLDEEKIRRYVKYQEQREKQAEKEQKEFGLF
jgi:putative transposase